jgi:hypothetical protein
MPSPEGSIRAFSQLPPDVVMIVDFTIENHYIPTGWGGHGLMAGWRKVKNCKPPVGQPDTEIGAAPDTDIIWPPVDNRF